MSGAGSDVVHGRRAVFLDRDGVLSVSLIRDGKGYAPRCLADFALYPEAAQAVEALKGAGFVVVVVTNQPDIGNGLTTADEVALMHRQLQDALPVDLVLTCPHKQGEGCACRKPKPGLLAEAVARLGLDPLSSFMVGDRSSDLAAGRAMGCRTIFIDRGYREPLTEVPHYRADSVWEAAQWILAQPADRC
ncbi:MAG: HAD-IIIA family hydrolase [Magnetococcales bacterium]|nr:HAD-IIIA family hydrolase [Magnetococcales bacterium]